MDSGQLLQKNSWWFGLKSKGFLSSSLCGKISYIPHWYGKYRIFLTSVENRLNVLFPAVVTKELLGHKRAVT